MAAGVNSKINTVNATIPSGMPKTGRCEPTARYQATGNSSNWVNTAARGPSAWRSTARGPRQNTAAPLKAEPDSGTHAVDETLVGFRAIARAVSNRGHRQRCHTLHHDDQSGARTADGAPRLPITASA